MIGASTFSGVGGMDLGLARAGIRHAFFAESDPWRRSVLAAHWPGVPIYDDVRVVGRGVKRDAERGTVAEPAAVESRGTRPVDLQGPNSRGDAEGAAGEGWRRHRTGGDTHPDLLCGGFPCQDLSVAGRRAGLAGSRSGLFHEFARIADTLRPRWILLENVPGLLSSNDGRDMGVVIGTLADVGYSVAWRVLDARYFGVPQRRRRVFIVGHLGDDDTEPLRTLCEGCSGHPATSDCTWQGTPSRPGASPVGTLQAAGGGRGWRIDAEGAAEGHLVVADTLTSGSHPGSNAPGRRREDDSNLIAFHQTQEPITGDNFSPAIGRTSMGMGVSGGAAVRRLTPVECERLMGWPDNWTAPEGVKAPDSRRYAACGDGVVANVAEWIGRRILAEHHGHDGEQHH